MKQRVDRLLVTLGLARSRHQAQELIARKLVSVSEAGVVREVKKNSEEFVPGSVQFQIKENDFTQYVSRGALKLKGALAHFAVTVHGASALDVGLSTGGFTQVLLEAGATKVVGVDVGTSQVHPNLLSWPNLAVFESLHVNKLASHAEFLAAVPPKGFDLMVVDVSFTSVQNVLPYCWPFLRSGGRLLCLVKPQFEVGSHNLGKNGIVKDPKIVVSLLADLRHKLESNLTLKVLGIHASELEGRDGNQEHFFYAQKH